MSTQVGSLRIEVARARNSKRTELVLLGRGDYLNSSQRDEVASDTSMNSPGRISLQNISADEQRRVCIDINETT